MSNANVYRSYGIETIVVEAKECPIHHVPLDKYKRCSGFWKIVCPICGWERGRAFLKVNRDDHEAPC